ncbi:MAG: glycosyltransferase [Muribaculum sp.]|nr:glycosyltransferase [Muribaculum sp.]
MNNLSIHNNATYIAAIIVLYKPNITQILDNIKILLTQVDEICYVDNTPNNDYSTYFENFSKVHYVSLNQNFGIAKAQNIGIKNFLKNKDIQYLLFLDQDSKIVENLAMSLKDEYIKLSNKDFVIAVGPQAISYDNKKSYVSEDSILQKFTIDDTEYWKMRNIPSSYSLINKENFIKYGFYNERLFIDCVEHEWFWRVKEKTNGDIYIIPSLQFFHQMGTPIEFLGYKTSISTPFRLYYQVRNVLWVAKLRYSPKSWRRKQLIRLFIKCIWYPVCISPRFKYLKSITRGIVDGVFKHS